jgi:hypothetical protein
MQWDLPEQLVTTVEVDLFGQAMFLQQMVLMELVDSKAAVHSQAAWIQIFKLVVAVVAQVAMVQMQFHPTAVLEV